MTGFQVVGTLYCFNIERDFFLIGKVGRPGGFYKYSEIPSKRRVRRRVYPDAQLTGWN